MTTLVMTGRILDGGSITYVSKEDADKVKNSKDFQDFHLVMKTATKYWYDGRPDSPTFGELFQNHPQSPDAILLDKNDFEFKK
jgi:hypothetical protein